MLSINHISKKANELESRFEGISAELKKFEDGVFPDPEPIAKELASAFCELLRYLSEFGLTPEHLNSFQKSWLFTSVKILFVCQLGQSIRGKPLRITEIAKVLDFDESTVRLHINKRVRIFFTDQLALGHDARKKAYQFSPNPIKQLGHANFRFLQDFVSGLEGRYLCRESPKEKVAQWWKSFFRKLEEEVEKIFVDDPEFVKKLTNLISKSLEFGLLLTKLLYKELGAICIRFQKCCRSSEEKLKCNAVYLNVQRELNKLEKLNVDEIRTALLN